MYPLAKENLKFLKEYLIENGGYPDRVRDLKNFLHIVDPENEPKAKDLARMFPTSADLNDYLREVYGVSLSEAIDGVKRSPAFEVRVRFNGETYKKLVSAPTGRAYYDAILPGIDPALGVRIGYLPFSFGGVGVSDRRFLLVRNDDTYFQQAWVDVLVPESADARVTALVRRTLQSTENLKSAFLRRYYASDPVSSGEGEGISAVLEHPLFRYSGHRHRFTGRPIAKEYAGMVAGFLEDAPTFDADDAYLAGPPSTGGRKLRRKSTR